MRNLDKLSAEQLLSANAPESLFSRDHYEAKQEYRNLARRWHPDHHRDEGGKASNVFSHIVELYRKAEEKRAKGTWNEPYEKIEQETPGLKKFACIKTGHVKTVEYLSARRFELGCMYIGANSVVFEVENEFSDLFHNGRRKIRGLRFQDENMAVEMSNFLPQIEDIFQTTSSQLLRIRKTPDQLLLADVLKYYATRIEPIEHVGWILNVLLHISCYLEWSGIAHNAISPETLFISPLRHSGMLLGGWWYAACCGEELKALPDRSLKFIPPDIIDNKIADTRADLELIKALGREILGDVTGRSLEADASLPEILPEWLQLPSGENAVAEYREWKYTVLERCFGEPHFVPMDLNSKDLYKEI